MIMCLLLLELTVHGPPGAQKFSPTCDRAKALCALAQAKNLAPEHMVLLKAIGFDVRIANERRAEARS